MAQNITLLGASYSAVPSVLLPKTGGGTARFDDASVTTASAADVASGKIFLASDGTITTGTASGGGGSEKAIQYSMGRHEVTAGTTYTSTGLSLKVTKAGTYKVYWVMDRTTTSGTNGTRLYNGSTALGTAHTTWTYNNNNRNAAVCEETLTFAANDTITVRGRSRSTSYAIGASNLIIIEQ